MNPDAGESLRTEVEAEITAIYVHPSVARNGVGSRVYAALEAEVIRQNIDSLGLWASRNAVPFYEAQGYERVADHSHEYRNGVALTVVEMVKQPVG